MKSLNVESSYSWDPSIDSLKGSENAYWCNFIKKEN